MKPLILLVMIFMVEAISAMDGANPFAAKATLDLETEVEKTAAEYRMEITELEKTQADLRMEIRELKESAGGYKMEMKKPRSVIRVRRRQKDPNTQPITKKSSAKCIGGDDQKTQRLLGGVTSVFTEMLTTTDADPGLQDGDKPQLLKLCGKKIRGSPDKILRQVLAEALDAMDLFGGVARCKQFGGVRVGTQCLYFSNSSMNWEDARAACKKMNGGKGQLASITKHQEFFDHMLKTNENGNQFWVGGSKASNDENWTWQNGQTSSGDITVLDGESDSNDKRCLAAWWDETYLDNTCTLEDRYICDLKLCEDYDRTYEKCVIQKVPKIMKNIKKKMKNTDPGLRGPCWGPFVWLFSFGFANDLPLDSVCYQD